MDIKTIIEKHVAWIGKQEGGERADLRGSDLRGANLRGANGLVSCFQAGQHYATAGGGYINIGCERHTYTDWLANYETIGKKYSYSDDEIRRYGSWIKSVVEWLSEEE